MKNASFLKLNFRDLAKGFLVAFLTVVVAGLSVTLDQGFLPTVAELKSLALTGLAAGGAYLLKNLFTNSQDKFLATEKKDPNKLQP